MSRVILCRVGEKTGVTRLVADPRGRPCGGYGELADLTEDDIRLWMF